VAHACLCQNNVYILKVLFVGEAELSTMLRKVFFLPLSVAYFRVLVTCWAQDCSTFGESVALYDLKLIMLERESALSNTSYSSLQLKWKPPPVTLSISLNLIPLWFLFSRACFRVRHIELSAEGLLFLSCTGHDLLCP
jgi:hypothetical protein